MKGIAYGPIYICDGQGRSCLAIGWGLLRRPGADGGSALRQRVAPVARLVRAGRAVLEGRALAADRSRSWARGGLTQ